MTRFILSFFALGLLLLVNSCCTKPPIDEVDYNDLFVNIADNIIVPRYAEFQTELEELTESLDAYNGSDLSLEILQNVQVVKKLMVLLICKMNIGQKLIKLG